MSLSIEDRILRLEAFMNWAKPLLEEVAKTLELSRPRVNPSRYCKDELDFRIIDYLIDHKAAGATEIAEALGLENPKDKGRHVVGKRILRLQRETSNDGWSILEFHPERREEKFRAWWLNVEDIDVEKFREELKKMSEKKA